MGQGGLGDDVPPGPEVDRPQSPGPPLARKAFHLLSSPTIPTDPPFQLPQHQEPGTQYPLPIPEYTASQDPDGKGGKYVEQRIAEGLR